MRARREQPRHGRRGRLPAGTDDGRAFRHLPLRNTNKKFNPVTAPTLHFPVYGDPLTGEVATADFDGAVEVWPVFGDGRPAVWRWSRPLIDERPDDLVCREINGRNGDAGRRLPARLAAPRRGTSQEAHHDLALRGGRLHRHGRRRAEGADRARLRVAQADRPGAADPGHDAARRRGARPLRRQRHDRSRGRARQRRRRREPALHQHQLRRADPAGVERRERRVRDGRRHHPAPGSPPSAERHGACGSSSAAAADALRCRRPSRARRARRRGRSAAAGGAAPCGDSR